MSKSFHRPHKISLFSSVLFVTPQQAAALLRLPCLLAIRMLPSPLIKTRGLQSPNRSQLRLGHKLHSLPSGRSMGDDISWKASHQLGSLPSSAPVWTDTNGAFGTIGLLSETRLCTEAQHSLACQSLSVQGFYAVSHGRPATPVVAGRALAAMLLTATGLAVRVVVLYAPSPDTWVRTSPTCLAAHLGNQELRDNFAQDGFETWLRIRYLEGCSILTAGGRRMRGSKVLASRARAALREQRSSKKTGSIKLPRFPGSLVRPIRSSEWLRVARSSLEFLGAPHSE